MRTKNGHLMVWVVLMVHLSGGAKIRLKRSSEIELKLDANGFCLEEKSWKEDCNDCFCTVNGAPACTLRGCIHKPELVSLIKGLDSTPMKADAEKVKRFANKPTVVDEKCVPGSTWTEVCNTCWCTDDGFSYCTRIGCVSLGK